MGISAANIYGEPPTCDMTFMLGWQAAFNVDDGLLSLSRYTTPQKN